MIIGRVLWVELVCDILRGVSFFIENLFIDESKKNLQKISLFFDV